MIVKSAIVYPENKIKIVLIDGRTWPLRSEKGMIHCLVIKR